MKDAAAFKIKKNKEVEAAKASEEEKVAAFKTRNERANTESAVAKKESMKKVPDIKDEEKGIEDIDKIEKVLEEKICLKVEKAIVYEKIVEVTGICYQNWRSYYQE